MIADLPQDLTEIKDTFYREGYVRIPGMLSPEQLDRLNGAVDRLIEAQPEKQLSYNLYGPIRESDELLEMVDNPKALRIITKLLDFNIQCYMTHLSVRHPNKEGETGGGSQTGWHMDGPTPYPHGVDGVIPVLSLKICYMLSDLSEPERGNTKIVPGSHRLANYSIDERDPNKPVENEMQVCGKAGDAFLFAQNLWHAAAPNLSQLTRRVFFLGYSYMWIRPLDHYQDIIESHPDLSDVAKQLLGSYSNKDHYFAKDKDLPLEKWVKERDKSQ